MCLKGTCRRGSFEGGALRSTLFEQKVLPLVRPVRRGHHTAIVTLTDWFLTMPTDEILYWLYVYDEGHLAVKFD